MTYIPYHEYKKNTDKQTTQTQQQQQPIHPDAQHKVIPYQSFLETLKENQHTIHKPITTISEAREKINLFESLINQEEDEFFQMDSRELFLAVCEDYGFKPVFNDDGTISETDIEILDDEKLVNLLNQSQIMNGFVYDDEQLIQEATGASDSVVLKQGKIMSVLKAVTGISTIKSLFSKTKDGLDKTRGAGVVPVKSLARVGGAGAVAGSLAGAAHLTGYGATATAAGWSFMTAALVGASLAAVAAVIASIFTVVIIKKNKGYVMRFGGLLHVRTKDMVHTIYTSSLKELSKKRGIPMKITSKGNETRVLCEFKMPNHSAPEFILTVRDDYISFFPLSTGGSTALDKYVFKRESIDLGGKKIDKSASAYDALMDELEGFRNRGFLGRDYKVPRRKLNYKEDMLVMWYVIVDMMSEIIADFSVMYQDLVRQLQASKNLDAQVFVDFMDKYDLLSPTLLDKESKEADRLRKRLEQEEEKRKAEEKAKKDFEKQQKQKTTTTNQNNAATPTSQIRVKPVPPKSSNGFYRW